MFAWIPEWLAFAGLMALGQFSPGPDMVLLTRMALARGIKHGCWAALGIASGLAMHAALAVTGVAAVLARGGVLVEILKWLAATYLLWLSFQLIRGGLKSKQLVISQSEEADAPVFTSWKRGFICNVLNPKVALFLAGVTAPFLTIPDAPQGWPVVLWATIVIEGLVLWCAWVFVLQSPLIRERYLRLAHWFDVAFGVALAALAVMLVFV